MKRRMLALATTISLAVAGLSATAAAGAPEAPSLPAVRGATSSVATAAASSLKWGTCSNPRLVGIGAKCAKLSVPLDYSKPKGKKIKLALSRVTHKPAAGAYQGIMLVNPGGPGGSGLIYSVFGTGGYIPGNGDLTYDWIGFDPRGVGSSSPALACDGKFTGYDRPNYVPTTTKLEKVWRKKSAAYAKKCANTKTKRALIKHMKTIDSAKDMDSIRKALGQKKINFYGFSYGTYLGQVYATKYPKRVGRFVFDGTVNPKRVWYKANLDQDLAFEKTINIWFGWLARNNPTFGLGTSTDVVRAGFYRQLAKLDRKAINGIGPDELTDVVLSAGYYVYDWVELGEAYATLVKSGDATGIRSFFAASNPQTKGSDNGFAVYNAVQCTDVKWPKKFSTWRTDNWRVYAKAPFNTWANVWFNAPCLTWKAKAGKPVKITGKKVTAKILMIGETYDAATPFSGSLVVRKLFKGASLIEGVGGSTHAGSLSGIACTDNAIGAYLTNGTVPKRLSGNRSDLKCPPVPQPDPTADADQRARTTAQLDLHRLLAEAQRP